VKILSRGPVANPFNGDCSFKRLDRRATGLLHASSVDATIGPTPGIVCGGR
jgi:hypothetical protein